MADSEAKRSYPMIPAKTWWDLRRRFQQSVPKQVTADYMQSVLGVGAGQANNLIPQLKTTGLIDANGKPTDLAMNWRSDDDYAEACKKVVENVFPEELRDGVPPGELDRNAAEGWFMRNARVGQSAAGKMTTFYALVSKADPSDQSATTKAERSSASTKPKRTTSSSRKPSVTKEQRKPMVEEPPPPPAHSGPSLHVDVQVHIPADASPEQVDQIFASMAKHLYGRG